MMFILFFMIVLTTTVFAETIVVMIVQACAQAHKVSFKNEACRLYRKNKKFKAMVIVAVVLNIQVVAVGAWYISAANDSGEYITRTVQQGDTLWKIAYEQYGDSVDTRKAIDVIERLNGIDDCCIRPGDSIKMPESMR